MNAAVQAGRAASRGGADPSAFGFRLAAAAFFACATCGCPGPQCEQLASLIDMQAWTLVAPADDPWDPPADALLCGADRARVEPFGEADAFEIDTSRDCGWATAVQPALLDASAGDDVQLRIYYFSQATFPEAEAELAVGVAGTPIWSTRVPIPAASTLLAPRVTLSQGFAAGAPISFHIGNHGTNTWNLVEISKVTRGICPNAT